MPYAVADARQQLLDTVAEATEGLGRALAALSEAYEQMDEQSADRTEAELFRPAQRAYGRAQRTYIEFAARHGLPAQTFEQPIAGAPSKGAKAFLEEAAQSVTAADGRLGTLQDSMLPVEVGDEQLRAGLEQVRELLAHFRAHVHEIERTLGR
jgi:hypothetical protein